MADDIRRTADILRMALVGLGTAQTLTTQAAEIASSAAAETARLRERVSDLEAVVAGLEVILAGRATPPTDAEVIAHAAAGAAVVALTELAQVLADNGIALGVPLGRVVDLVGSVVDTLVPACNLDAGFASAGRSANARLLGIERDARSRGVILRRDLDRITPALDGGL